MNSKKLSIRLGAIISTAIFFLVPLLSSPVAAAGTGTYNCFADTDNTPGGPTAQAACPPPYTISGLGANMATFTCTYTFIDSNSAGTGSNHRATLTVSPPGPATGQASTGWVFIVANGGTVSGTISVGPLAYTPPTSWSVTLEVWCWDLASGGAPAYATVTVTVTG